MHRVEPQVFVVAETVISDEGIQEYLDHIGAHTWESDAQTDVEEIIEIMGRSCYKSFGVGLNPNLVKVRSGNAEHVENLIQSGHGACLEHAWVSFMFCDVSRVLTHELARHRVGVAISQESLRFVRLEDMGLWIPQCFRGDDASEEIFEETWLFLERQYRRLLDRAAAIETFRAKGYDRIPRSPGCNFNELDFAVKKKYTSAARRVAPIGLATNIGWSCNMRTLRGVIEQRTAPAAEEEIRLMFGEVAAIAQERWPHVFGDYQVETVDGLPHYKTEHRKV